jgi:hypothetical protein
VIIDGDRRIGPLAAPSVISVLPPRREFVWDVSAGVDAYDGTFGVAAELEFTDARGIVWCRDPAGSLVEGPPRHPIRYGDEDPDAAEAQLGAADPFRNPMATVRAFLAFLSCPDQELDVELFRGTLDPYASGWSGNWDSARIDFLRQLVDGLSLAAFTTYATNSIAYVRLFSAQALDELSSDGKTYSAKFITLVRRRNIGWVVFGVGAQVPPDRIEMPVNDQQEADPIGIFDRP